MAEYIERGALDKALTTAAANDKDKNRRTWAKAICVLHDLPAADVEKMSDGYHTFADLYEQRLVLSAALAKNNPHAWKSKRHEDGSVPFGGGWFIMGFDTSEGCYTYHYELKDWDLFQCKELEKGKPWDGHTSKDVRRLLSIPAADVAPVVPGRWIEREEKPIFPHELVGPTEAVADYLLDSGVTAQEWISVKDRLPKNDEIVIICTDKNFIYAGELIGDTWFLDNDSWTATVTHWMPLPQPPKG